MLYTHLHPNSRTPVYEHSDVGNRPFDWGWDVDAGRLRWQHVDSMASYVDEAKREAGGALDDGDVQADVAMLVPEQWELLEAYISTYHRILQGETVETMFLNIDGTAECGKTHLIQTVCQTLRKMAVEGRTLFV